MFEMAYFAEGGDGVRRAAAPRAPAPLPDCLLAALVPCRPPLPTLLTQTTALDRPRITALSEEADVMLFAGEPIGAPVASSGTMVMNTQQQLQEAMSDYRRGTFGIPWDHALEDEQWADHCAGITRPS